jgi:hypothetical protein
MPTRGLAWRNGDLISACAFEMTPPLDPRTTVRPETNYRHGFSFRHRFAHA